MQEAFENDSKKEKPYKKCDTTISEIVNTKEFTNTEYPKMALASYVEKEEPDDDNMLIQTLMKRCRGKLTKQNSRKKLKLGKAS